MVTNIGTASLHPNRRTAKLARTARAVGSQSQGGGEAQEGRYVNGSRVFRDTSYRRAIIDSPTTQTYERGSDSASSGRASFAAWYVRAEGHV